MMIPIRESVRRVSGGQASRLIRFSDPYLSESESASTLLAKSLDQRTEGRPQGFVEVAREVALETMAVDQFYDVGQISSPAEIRAAAFELHPDQIGQTDGKDPVDLHGSPGRLVDKIPRHKLHGDSIAHKLSPLLVEVESCRDQQIIKILRSLINEDIDILGRSRVPMKIDGDPTDDHPRDVLPAHQFGEFSGQIEKGSAPFQEFQGLLTEFAGRNSRRRHSTLSG
ncbi:MAG TPA: hypothetical protein VFF52_23530 [Isosphaeraceae bacterium]|nr:hypothetical protein [Isosphaeraceae bacterium]